MSAPSVTVEDMDDSGVGRPFAQREDSGDMTTTAQVVNDDSADLTDPLAPLKQLGARVCWVPNLGDPAVYVPSHRVMLLDAGLSRAEVYAYVRRWVLGRFPEFRQG